MRLYTLVLSASSIFLAISCNGKKATATSLFEITIKNLQKTYTPADNFNVSLLNKENTTIDSLAYFIGSKKLESSIKNTEVNISLENEKLGNRVLLVKIYSGTTVYEISKKITVLSSITPKLYSYSIIEEYPHDTNAYTQGLEFKNDTLYESTGQYKNSSLRKTNFKPERFLQKFL